MCDKFVVSHVAATNVIGLKYTRHILQKLTCVYCQQTRARAGDLWPVDRPDGMPVIQSLEVMCGKDHMDVHLTFSHPFEGIVSSKGELTYQSYYRSLVLFKNLFKRDISTVPPVTKSVVIELFTGDKIKILYYLFN